MYNLQNTFSVFDAVYTISAHNFISKALIRMYIQSMVVWVVEISIGGYKIRNIFAKELTFFDNINFKATLLLK